MVNKMVTKVDIREKLESKEIASDLKTVLILIEAIPGVYIDAEMRRTGDEIVGKTKRYALPDTLRGVSEGALLFAKGKGGSYAQSGLQMKINAMIKSEFGCTLRVIQGIYAEEVKTQALQRFVNEEDLKELSKEDYELDEEVSTILEGYGIYSTPTNCYPFIIVELPGGHLVPYAIYKVAANLPFYQVLDGDYRVPTVDHIWREPRDNRRSSMRYCTMKQNGRNKCQPFRKGVGMYHCVSSTGAMMMNPGTSEERVTIDAVSTWFTLFERSRGVLKINIKKIKKTLKWLTEDGGCKSVSHRLEDKPLIDAFIGELIEMLQTTAPEGYELAKRTMLFEKSKIPTLHYKGKAILEVLYDNAESLIKVTRTFKEEYMMALAVDVVKIILHGSFAHTNFVKVEGPTVTVKDNGLKAKAPDDILNEFEPELTMEALQVWNESAGLGYTGKRIYETVLVNGLKRVVAHHTTTHLPRRVSIIKVDEERTTVIKSPYMVYRNVNSTIDGDVSIDGEVPIDGEVSIDEHAPVDEEAPIDKEAPIDEEIQEVKMETVDDLIPLIKRATGLGTDFANNGKNAFKHAPKKKLKEIYLDIPGYVKSIAQDFAPKTVKNFVEAVRKAFLNIEELRAIFSEEEKKEIESVFGGRGGILRLIEDATRGASSRRRGASSRRRRRLTRGERAVARYLGYDGGEHGEGTRVDSEDVSRGG